MVIYLSSLLQLLINKPENKEEYILFIWGSLERELYYKIKGIPKEKMERQVPEEIIFVIKRKN